MNRPVIISSKSRPHRLRLAGMLWLSCVAAGYCLEPHSTERTRLTTLANAPLYFESSPKENAAGFVARGRECNVWLAPDEAVLVFGKHNLVRPTAHGTSSEASMLDTRSVRLTLLGANPSGTMTGLEPLPGKANYFIGNDPADWRTGVPLFSKVRVDQVYPGIGLVYYADESARLEYDFLLQPHARADRISFRVEGADRLFVDALGDLVLAIGDEEIRQHRPVIYQETRGVRQPVAGGYRLIGKDTVGFWLGDYDTKAPLVIDPTLSFSTYLGGTKAELGWAIALDAIGNVYVAGETLSKKLSLPGAATSNFQGTNYNGGKNSFGDAFVAKYNAVSNQLVYLTYLGGKFDDGALGLAVDAAGIAYVTGFTDSRNFPIVPTNGAIRSIIGGPSNNAFRIPHVDAFVTALDPSGSTLLFSTFLGGTRRDSGVSIAVDASGVYVAGYTESTNFFPITNAVQPVSGGNGDVFVTKLGLAGNTVVYSTYLGGGLFENPEGIAVDAAGNAIVTGFTFSTNFPLVNPIVLNGQTYTNLNNLTNKLSGSDAFITKLSADGASLFYSTYLGGSNNDAGLSVAVDGAGNAYVTGYTFSKNFPTNTMTLPASPGTNFVSHAFVTVVDAADNLLYSTQFGGNSADQGTGIALDAGGTVYVTGFAASTNFFNTNAFTDFRSASTNSAGKKIKVTSPNNAFVAVLTSDLSAFVSTNSIMLGGAGDDQPNGIAVNPSGAAAYIVGTTTSVNLRVTNSVQSTLLQTNLGGVKNNKASDAFIGKIEFP